MSNPLFQTEQVRVAADGTILRNHGELLRMVLRNHGIVAADAVFDGEPFAAAITDIALGLAAWPYKPGTAVAPAGDGAPKKRRTRKEMAELKAAKEAAAAAGASAEIPAPPTPVEVQAPPLVPAPAPPPAAPAPPPVPAPPAPTPPPVPAAPLPQGTVAGIPTVPPVAGAAL